MRKQFVQMGISVLCLGLSACGTSPQMLADKKVNELCSKDGGLHVYEKVQLPATSFNGKGFPLFYRENGGEQSLGPGYRFLLSTNNIPNFDLVYKHSEQIIRIKDRKLLGETIYYTRKGGDLLPISNPSVYGCQPPYKGSFELLVPSVFVVADML